MNATSYAPRYAVRVHRIGSVEASRSGRPRARRQRHGTPTPALPATRKGAHGGTDQNCATRHRHESA
jgi:hypothetical protein